MSIGKESDMSVDIPNLKYDDIYLGKWSHDVQTGLCKIHLLYS